MKFGLLNADVNTAQYAAALVAAGCELTLIHEEAAGVPESLPADSAVRRVDQWEEALACGADFVLVGAAGPEPRRLEQLQRLVQEGMPVLFVHPQTTATLAYFELDMHRQATNVALVPLEATRHQPAVDSLKELGADRRSDRRASRAYGDARRSAGTVHLRHRRDSSPDRTLR